MAISVTSSFARVHTTGAVHNFIRNPPDPGDGTPAVAYYYLGTCQQHPVIQIHKSRLNVMNDIGGRMVPFQKIEQGEEATISLLLNRYSNTAYGVLLASPQGNWASESAGLETRYHRGQLTYGLHTFGLYQVFDFYGQTFPGADKLIQGYYWPTVELVDHNLIQSGTAESHLALAFKAAPTWNTSTLGFGLYDNVGNNAEGAATIAELLALVPTAAVT